MATIIQKCWTDLDGQVDRIVELAAKVADLEAVKPMTPVSLLDLSEAREAVALAKAEARGMATLLFHFMAPHYADVDAVARESSARKHYRDAGQPYISPGLSS